MAFIVIKTHFPPLIYTLCFLWSVRIVDWTDGFQPHLEDLEGETERGGRPRPLLDSPCSSLFLISAALTNFCRLSASFSHDWCNSFFVSVFCPFPPPPETVHSPPNDSYHHLPFPVCYSFPNTVSNLLLLCFNNFLSLILSFSLFYLHTFTYFSTLILFPPFFSTIYSLLLSPAVHSLRGNPNI